MKDEELQKYLGWLYEAKTVFLSNPVEAYHRIMNNQPREDYDMYIERIVSKINTEIDTVKLLITNTHTKE